MVSRIVGAVALAPLAALTAVIGASAQAQVSAGRGGATAAKPVVVQPAPMPAVAAPQGLTVTATSNGPQLSWKGATGAMSYQVLRAAGSATGIVIATVPASTLSYLDRGFNSSATYQVATVTSTQQRATSAGVSYTPTSQRTAVSTPPAVVSAKLAPPTMTPAWVYDAVLIVGDTVIVNGANLASIKSLTIVGNAPVCNLFSSCNAGCTVAQLGGNCKPDSTRVKASFTPIATSQTSFSFVVPNLAGEWVSTGTTRPGPYYLHVVAGGGSFADVWPFQLRAR
jgi:hypothetical protein